MTELRYRSEGTGVDFKSAQYRFIRASEEDKSELLKDILAMANAWRDGPGYIVLGFKDQRPHPAEVVGISESLDDAQLQQFVNSKVHPKLTFHYEEHVYQSRTVGLLTIPKQKRPFYLANGYGKLKSNVVYVRRGSSTDEAGPPEVIQMGQADSGRGEMRLDLAVLTRDNQDLPETATRRFLRFTEDFPDFESPRDYRSFQVSSVWHDNRHYWREYAEYVRVDESIVLMQFVLRNRSEVPLSNAKLELLVEPLDGQEFEMLAGADVPEAPSSQWSTFRTLPEVLARQNPDLVVDERGATPVCHARLGTLLPSEEGRSSDTLAIVPSGSGQLRLRMRVLASELATPYERELVLQVGGERIALDFEGFKELVRERLRHA